MAKALRRWDGLLMCLEDKITAQRPDHSISGCVMFGQGY
jgi:hypothetical protein